MSFKAGRRASEREEHKGRTNSIRRGYKSSERIEEMIEVKGRRQEENEEEDVLGVLD